MHSHSQIEDFLGRHTALSISQQKSRAWRRIRYLRENDGHAPPLVLAVGDRRRVHSIAHRLKNPVLLSETAARLSNPESSPRELLSAVEFGRVAMAIGTYKAAPILVVETQMGAPAAQIVMNEVLSDLLTSKEYRVGNSRTALRHKVVLRVGTAGAINCEIGPTIKSGDVVNATHSIGATGATMQALSRLDFWSLGAYEEFKREWKSLGSAFTITREGHPRVECSREIVEAIREVGPRIAKNAYHESGNVTKDSLYAERSEGIFLDLCRTENCRTTEMELSTVAVAAHEHEASFGMVSAIVGVLPGSSFAENSATRRRAEDAAVRIGLESLASFS